MLKLNQQNKKICSIFTQNFTNKFNKNFHNLNFQKNSVSSKNLYKIPKQYTPISFTQNLKSPFSQSTNQYEFLQNQSSQFYQQTIEPQQQQLQFSQQKTSTSYKPQTIELCSSINDPVNNNNSQNSTGGNPLPPSNGDNNNNNDNNDNPNEILEDGFLKLKTVPLKNYKAELTEEELSIKQEKHILFSSNQPILPYTSVPCQLRTGNLSQVDNPLAYFLLNEDGEIYLTGIQLESKVESELKKNIQSSQDPEQPATQDAVQEKNDISGLSLSMVITPKSMLNRVKIAEIIVNDQGIFAMTIPYKDTQPSLEQEQFNMDTEFELIRGCVKNIKKSVSYEKIDIFQDFDIDKMNFREFTVEQIDQVIFQIVQHIQKLYARYMKDNLNQLIQSLLQSRNIITRIQLIRYHLESLDDVLDIVNKNFKAADENLIRMHTQARARMSMEYIKSNYFGGNRDPSFVQGGLSSGQGGGIPNVETKSPQQQHQALIKKYTSQLALIDDAPSREKISKEIQRFSMIDKHSTEYHKVNTYLDEVFSIPWKKYSAPYWDINYAQDKLNEQIFGLEKVKQRIIEMIAINQLKNQTAEQSKGFIIMLYGPPGIGKTSIAKAVASSLKKEYRFISFAGVSDPFFIKGHRRTYVDSQPGIFCKELIKSDTMNPVFILDEIDKVSRSSMGADPYYNLLEILNPDENSNFVDHYMDIKIDFSNVIFILTANEILHMLEPLKNRLELIELPAYIEDEKLQIGKRYLIPRVFKQQGMNESLIQFNDQSLSTIINNWCFHESGVREFKRSFETICRKYAVELLLKYPALTQHEQTVKEEIQLQQQQEQEQQNKEKDEQQLKQQDNNQTENQEKATAAATENNATQAAANTNSEQQQPATQQTNQESAPQNILLNNEKLNELNIEPLDLTQENHFSVLTKYLGTPKNDVELEKRSNRIFPSGTVNILTVAGFVGHALTVECVYDNTQIDKKGIFSSSGNLKNVLKESLQIAKINAYKLLSKDQIQFANDQNYHIHFMQGAVPKDGPSAGTAITTAFLSLILDKPVPSNIAMTGEISLNGEVCKIGGLQSKLIGSKSVDIDTVLVPYANMNECLEFPQQLLDGLTVYFVKEYSQIYQILFDRVIGENVPGVITMKNGNIVNPNYISQTIINQQNITIDNNNSTINNY